MTGSRRPRRSTRPSLSESTVRALTVSPERAGQRVDLFVGEALGLSRSRLKALFEKGAVRVAGRPAKKGQLVSAGQEIRVELSEAPRAPVPQPELSLRVLHVDDELVFVEKPAGWPSHPLEPEERGTVANALCALYPELAEASVDPREGGLCHRLDVETSGVLLAARTRDAWEKVREAFSRRDVEKLYWAVVTGPIADEGEIELPLKHHGDRVQPAAEGGDDAREATSRFRVLDRKGEYSLVEVQIITGVLHQVRAHLSAIGAPLLGDALYGGREEPGLSRFFLHARSLALNHPTTGKRLSVQSPLPEELAQVLSRLGMKPPA